MNHELFEESDWHGGYLGAGGLGGEAKDEAGETAEHGEEDEEEGDPVADVSAPGGPQGRQVCVRDGHGGGVRRTGLEGDQNEGI